MMCLPGCTSLDCKQALLVYLKVSKIFTKKQIGSTLFLLLYAVRSELDRTRRSHSMNIRCPQRRETEMFGKKAHQPYNWLICLGALAAYNS